MVRVTPITVHKRTHNSPKQHIIIIRQAVVIRPRSRVKVTFVIRVFRTFFNNGHHGKGIS